MKTTTKSPRRSKSTKNLKVVPFIKSIPPTFKEVVRDWISKNPDADSTYFEETRNLLYSKCFEMTFDQMIKRFGKVFTMGEEDSLLLKTAEMVSIRLIRKGFSPKEAVLRAFEANILKPRVPFLDAPF